MAQSPQTPQPEAALPLANFRNLVLLTRSPQIGNWFDRSSMTQAPAPELYSWLPPEGVKIVLVLFLSFLVGLEREEHKSSAAYSFGGVRTFPLIGLIGYAVALLSGG
jgi:hypothetical protein